MSDSQEEIWSYHLLEVRVDPEFKEAAKDIEIDLVSWKTFIYNALLRLHGQFGVAIDNDVVKRKGLKAVVRIQKEDLMVFKSSIVAFTTNLSAIGYDDMDAHINIEQLNDVSNDNDLDKINI